MTLMPNGHDAQEGQYGDLVSKGIIDPTKVVRTALQDAGFDCRTANDDRGHGCREAEKGDACACHAARRRHGLLSRFDKRGPGQCSGPGFPLTRSIAEQAGGVYGSDGAAFAPTAIALVMTCAGITRSYGRSCRNESSRRSRCRFGCGCGDGRQGRQANSVTG
jgi:hypothetical protein